MEPTEQPTDQGLVQSVHHNSLQYQPIANLPQAQPEAPQELETGEQIQTKQDDVQPLLAPEYHPQVQQPPAYQVQPGTAVTVQPHRQQQPGEIPKSWVGSQVMMYISLFILVFCGFLPGLVALLLSWEAIKRRERQDYKGARWYSIFAIVSNIVGVLVGVWMIIGVVIWLSFSANSDSSQSTQTNYYG